MFFSNTRWTQLLVPLEILMSKISLKNIPIYIHNFEHSRVIMNMKLSSHVFQNHRNINRRKNNAQIPLIIHHNEKNQRIYFWCAAKDNWASQISEVVLKGWLTGFFLGLIVFMGCSLACVHAWFFLKTHYFSHNLPLFHTSLSLLWQTPRFISWFYEAPPSEIRDGLRLVSWLSVLWLAKPPLLHVWTSRPSPQWHVLRLNCKQWRCL